MCDFQKQDKRQIIREILNRVQQLTYNNEAQYRDCMLMLEILSENRDLSGLIKEEESMLSAIKLEDLPSYEIGVEKGIEKGGLVLTSATHSQAASCLRFLGRAG